MALTLSAVAIWAIRAGWLARYPYGPSHCCDKILVFALSAYADTNGGWFPRGEATPEASLSLLLDIKAASLETLAGKRIELEAAERQIAATGRLSPETCDWHYVEGLRSDDDPTLALFFDKGGLGHNGEYRSEGGYRVGRIAGHVESITADQWPEFVRQQRAMHAKLDRPVKFPEDVPATPVHGNRKWISRESMRWDAGK